MVSALTLRGHFVHVVVFGIPVAALVGALGLQEIRGRRGNNSAAPDRGGVGPRTTRAGVRLDGRSTGLRLAAAGLVVAAAIHAVVIPEHFRESGLYGVFFSALAAAQFLLAAMVSHRPDARTVRYVAVGSAWVVVLYLVSRTSGLPVGPEQWRPESFGGLDIAATFAELVTFAGCLMQVRTVSNGRRPSTRLPGVTT